jgi:Ni,Fe-hydrogenase III component G
MQKITLYKKLQIPANLYYLVDAAQCQSYEKTSLYFSFSTLLTDNRELLVISAKTNTFQVPSLATIFKAAVWLERELSDFSGLSFKGLTDTRGLLLDYLDIKSQRTTHNMTTPTYSPVVYEVICNY